MLKLLASGICLLPEQGRDVWTQSSQMFQSGLLFVIPLFSCLKEFIRADFLPISSSSEVIDLDLRAIAGVLSLLLCWATKGEGEQQSLRLRIHLQQYHMVQ